MSQSCHVIIADDHPLYLEALVNGLTKHIPEAQIAQADNYLKLFDELHQNADDIDLLIMDLFMPGSSGFTGLSFLRAQFQSLPIIVISSLDDLPTRSQCLSQGAAFISKSAPPAEIFNLVTRILDGTFQLPQARMDKQPANAHNDKMSTLTPSQFKVLHLIAAGHANKVIASELNISEKTVKAHISAIFEKLGVTNRTQAAMLLSDGSR